MKPHDFLIGIREFFAYLIPGVVFLFLITPNGWPRPDQQTLFLIGFPIAAYICGAVTGGFGSALDYATESLLRNAALRHFYSPEMAKREALAKALQKRILDTCLPAPARLLHTETALSFWRDHLRLNCSPATIELDAREAYQKLFRSLVAVFLIALVLSFFQDALRQTNIPLIDRRPSPAFFLASILSAVIYIGGRLAFQGAVYRLGVAYCVKEGEQLRSTVSAPVDDGTRRRGGRPAQPNR